MVDSRLRNLENAAMKGDLVAAYQAAEYAFLSGQLGEELPYAYFSKFVKTPRGFVICQIEVSIHYDLKIFPSINIKDIYFYNRYDSNVRTELEPFAWPGILHLNYTTYPPGVNSNDIGPREIYLNHQRPLPPNRRLQIAQYINQYVREWANSAEGLALLHEATIASILKKLRQDIESIHYQEKKLKTQQNIAGKLYQRLLETMGEKYPEDPDDAYIELSKRIAGGFDIKSDWKKLGEDTQFHIQAPHHDLLVKKIHVNRLNVKGRFFLGRNYEINLDIERHPLYPGPGFGYSPPIVSKRQRLYTNTIKWKGKAAPVSERIVVAQAIGELLKEYFDRHQGEQHTADIRILLEDVKRQEHNILRAVTSITKKQEEVAKTFMLLLACRGP